MKRIFFTIFLFATAFLSLSAFAASRKQAPLKLSKENGFEAKSLSGTQITEVSGCYQLVSNGYYAGIKFDGDFDLSTYVSLRFTFENKDAVHPMFICCDMLDSRAEKKNFTGRTNRCK